MYQHNVYTRKFRYSKNYALMKLQFLLSFYPLSCRFISGRSPVPSYRVCRKLHKILLRWRLIWIIFKSWASHLLTAMYWTLPYGLQEKLQRCCMWDETCCSVAPRYDWKENLICVTFVPSGHWLYQVLENHWKIYSHCEMIRVGAVVIERWCNWTPM